MIRRRLTLAITLTVALVVAIGSWRVVDALEDRLIANVDAEFTSGALSADMRRQLDRGFPARRSPGIVDERQKTAIVRYDREGELTAAQPSGTDRSPDPLPEGADLSPDDGLVTIGATDGETRYRAMAVDLTNGGRLVVASSLAEVDETVDEARRIQQTVTLVAVLVVAGVCWFLIRRAFAPIDDMIATAGRIAEGDLSTRTNVDRQTTEVGRLGTALDAMLDRLESAIDDKTWSEARMRQFVADASHDLRTPLTSVRGYADLYHRGAREPDEIELAMTRISTEADRMSHLVDDLMLLARLDRTRPPNPEPTDLGKILGEATDAARVADDSRVYDLDLSPDVMVLGDAHQLRRVFDNLLSNARSHTPPGTTVTITTEVRSDDVVVTVDDDGPGFATDDASHAFDRFWRSTRADQREGTGAGLGLSIVESIVAAHGGVVTLDQGPAGGARFTVALPVGPRADQTL